MSLSDEEKRREQDRADVIQWMLDRSKLSDEQVRANLKRLVEEEHDGDKR